MTITPEFTGSAMTEFYANESLPSNNTVNSPTIQAVVDTAIESAEQWHSNPEIASHFTATEEAEGSYGQALDYFGSIAADTLNSQGIPFDADQLTWMIQRHFICG